MTRTAGNTALLATIKRQYNTKIYKHALAIYNAEGEAATLAYLQQFSRNDIREDLGMTVAA